jgi:hypothetical protein
LNEQQSCSLFCSHTADVGVPPTSSRRVSRDEPHNTILLLIFIAHFTIDNQLFKIEVSNKVAHFFAHFPGKSCLEKVNFSSIFVT